ncbi:class I SAM-dependent methyltransferase [Sulfurihydrogenibium yellowstonense]|uniref:Glycosyl transferase family 2 n=1 Tax=Sulfurihydrogenibium yellowstonense SS-5 TaxID=432331 RepID=C4FLC7_9AQUI|nr:class I SAM-dependent methyltransferase [Sulfurihydrogenibium yellowstonense]EEP60119.1 glycosyl transferase family 2 [Sulfurihydrogenibium yellowstonense SS-5]
MSYKEIYATKPIGYFSFFRYDIIKLINCNNCNILEIGCGQGNTLIELKKQGKAKFIAGIDIVDLNQSIKLDKFILADIESEDNIDLPENYFDIIICADVLEHLKDPWNVLEKIKRFLKPNGTIIASIPNIREISALANMLINILIRGDFRYVDAGILDKTHLRFFCKKNIIELFEKTGYKVEKITFDLSTSPIRRPLLKLSFGLLEEFLVVQYLVVSRKIEYSNG